MDAPAPIDAAAPAGRGLPATAAERPMAGILLMTGFAVVAPVMDVFAKLVSDAVPAGETAFVRFAAQVLILVPLAALLGRLRRPATRDLPRHLVRGALLAFATILYFEALGFMPLADAIAIFFVEPFLLILLSAALLGEGIGWRRLAGCAVGFGGALLVIQPAFAEVGWPAVLPLGTALFFALYLVMTREMARRSDPLDLQAWTAWGGALVLGAVLLAFEGTGHRVFDPVLPPPGTWGLLAGVGMVATVSHLLITWAFRFAPAAVIAPIQYVEIVTAVLLGRLVFGDFPNALAMAGIAVIVGSGLYVAWRERVARGRQVSG